MNVQKTISKICCIVGQTHSKCNLEGQIVLNWKFDIYLVKIFAWVIKIGVTYCPMFLHFEKVMVI